MKDPYLYPDTQVLKNKFDERDKERLDMIEAEYPSSRIQDLILCPLEGNYDFPHYCRMHEYIFQDVYDWAGQQRIINIEKEEVVLGGLSVEYSEFQDIPHMASSSFFSLNHMDWEKMDLNERAEKFSKCMAEIWKVHCFREGNTRTTITFFCQYADSHGFPMDRELLRQNSEYVRTALVAASAYFTDLGDKSKPEYLIRIIKDSMQRGMKKVQEKEMSSKKMQEKELPEKQIKPEKPKKKQGKIR